MDYTQQGRPIAVQTPLGEDKLLLRSFTGHEEMSRLFRFHLDMLSLAPDIKPKDIVGKNITVKVILSDQSTERYFNGFVSRFVQLPAEGTLYRYQAEMVPWLWFLTCATDCRIFQEKSIPEIVEQVFKDFGFSDFEVSLRGTHNKWEYCVQYRETAFNFVSRLMEQEGIFYHFRHEKDKHMLVLADHKSIHKLCPYQSSFRMEPSEGRGFSATEDSINYWERRYGFRPGKWAMTDYNFKTPSTSLLSEVESVIALDGMQKFQIFDFPGEYHTRGDGDQLVKLRMEEEEVGYDVVHGAGGGRTFSPGCKFTLKHHDQKDQQGDYVLTSVTHSGDVGGYFGGALESEASYRNTFTCIPASVQYRPARVTPKPLVQGTQTAVVTGPPGEEIYPDKYGRVKVQFHWDRYGKKDEKTSCWIRISTPWAGKNWGGIAIPRIGQEVVVDFIEGDPDCPLITGRVYNAEQMPPYDLPGSKVVMGYKSRSTPGGVGYNEMICDDTKGKERINIHAQYDMSTTVEHDETLTVHNNRTTTVDVDHSETVGNNQTVDIGVNQTESVGSNRSISIGANDSLDVGANRDTTIGANHTVSVMGKEDITVAGSQTITVSGPISITSMASISLTVGGSNITIAPAVITLTSPMIKLN